MLNNTSPRSLPSLVDNVDLGDWATLTPEQLLEQQHSVVGAEDVAYLDSSSAAKSIKYGRSGPSQSYDLIAFRTVAACPSSGPRPCLTLNGLCVPNDEVSECSLTTPHPEARRAVLCLKHRQNGAIGWTIEKKRLPIFPPDHLKPSPDMASIPLTLDRPWFEGVCDETGRELYAAEMPPDWARSQTMPLDMPTSFTQRGQIISIGQTDDIIPGMYWLSLTTLITAGRFKSLNEPEEERLRQLYPGCFFIFLSHRWRGIDHPDPDHQQAAYVSWQLVAFLCEAIKVAARRGVWQSRKYNTGLNSVDGIAGSDLAESLLVNVVRPAIRAGLPWELIKEVDSLDDRLCDGGVAAAGCDIGLDILKRLLEERPFLRRLTARIYLWYDFSCLPQQPRSAEQEQEFGLGLKLLNTFQTFGRTVILLDDLNDHLSRAWCVLEAIVANNLIAIPNLDILVGPKRAARENQGDVTVKDRDRLHYVYDLILRDRPHLVWRGVLDTEIFRIQTPTACFERLEIECSVPEDSRFIYSQLRDRRLPSTIAVDNSEIVTGMFPLPQTQFGSKLLFPQEGVGISHELWSSDPRQSLDWTGALSIGTAWNTDDGDDPWAVPPLITFDSSFWSKFVPKKLTNQCHVAVVGACEGEAILLANWVCKRRIELASMLSVNVISLSWLATDIAPVGHFASGCLRACPISAPVWIVVAVRMRFSNCHTTKLLLNAIYQSGCKAFLFAIDESKENVLRLPKWSRKSGIEGWGGKEVDIKATSFPTHHGGLYRGAIPRDLL